MPDAGARPTWTAYRGEPYMSQAAATVHRIINGASLVKELVPVGFEVVCLDGIPFTAQVRLFSGADIIVGPHGGGLTNMTFAQPSATVIEVFPPSYIESCFWALANACGHHYRFAIGMRRGQDIAVDIGRIFSLLDAMREDSYFQTDFSK